MTFISVAYQKTLETAVLWPSRLLFSRPLYKGLGLVSDSEAFLLGLNLVLDWKDWRVLIKTRGDSVGCHCNDAIITEKNLAAAVKCSVGDTLPPYSWFFYYYFSNFMIQSCLLKWKWLKYTLLRRSTLVAYVA